MSTVFKNILKIIIKKKKHPHCCVIIEGIYRHRQWSGEEPINNGCPKTTRWREMKPNFLITEVWSLEKLLNKASLVSLFPWGNAARESGYRSNDCGWQKIAAVHGGSYAERMFRLLQRFGIWGAIKSDLCHLTSAACMSQPLQDYRRNCKELIVCIFIPWMPVFYAWMSTPWRNVSSSLAWDLAHSGTWLVSS